MGLLQTLLGKSTSQDAGQSERTPARGDDEGAIERYRYMVRTAPPETLERAHEEAFEKLNPEQRRAVLEELRKVTPAGEQTAEAQATEPRALARLATRAEYRQPGVMERALGGASPGMGLLGSFAAGFAGSMVAQTFLSSLGAFGDGGHEDPALGDEEADATAGDDGTLASEDVDGGGFDFDV